MAGLGPRAASEAIATAFADQGAQVAVIPVGSGGEAVAAAVSVSDAAARLVPVNGLTDLLTSIRPGEGTLHLDLAGLDPVSLPELVAAATAEVVTALRGQLAGRNLLAVVPEDGAQSPLTGLQGALAELGRRRDAELSETISEDGRAERWAAAVGVDPLAPGAGALGGLGALVMALGGTVTTGLELCVQAYRLPEVMAKADVVVTGAAQLDFHAVGGPVVKRLAQLAEESLRPIIVIAGRTYVSARELRLAGIEAAYPVLPGTGDVVPTPQELDAVARRVAATWRW